jgi:hypothetical protein
MGKGIKNEEEKKGVEEAIAANTSSDGKTRVLVGVMRVGLLAKQLLLR